MTAGLNSRPKEWSRPPEPHPPDAGCWCSRNKRRPYVSLIWCSVPSGHASGLRPRIRNNDRRTAHEPLNLTLDFKHAHVRVILDNAILEGGAKAGPRGSAAGVMLVFQIRLQKFPAQLEGDFKALNRRVAHDRVFRKRQGFFEPRDHHCKIRA